MPSPTAGHGLPAQTHQSRRVVEELVGVALRGPAPALVLDPQPSTQPTARRGIHGSIRRRHRAEAVVPPPARQHPVHPPHQRLGLPPLGTSGGQAADRPRRPPHTSLRRPRAHIGPPRVPGVAPSDGVTQKRHALVRNPANRALGLVHRQPHALHHRTHDRHRRRCVPAPTADDEIVRIVDDARAEPTLMPQYLPSQPEAAHVQIRQQWRDDALNAKGNFRLRCCRCRVSTGPDRRLAIPRAGLNGEW